MKSWSCVALAASLLCALSASCAAVDDREGLDPEGLDPGDEAAAGDPRPSIDELAPPAATDVQCGNVVCGGDTRCCNASCGGHCVPRGAVCPNIACQAGQPASAGGADDVWSPEGGGFRVGEQCGAVFCTGATPHCCNASCGKCVPLGAECTQEQDC
ncbi:MAG TPA: hypothetical protein VKB80_30335 [Kofleriaceae bacterium]|nr:hypothetical protein [Kofleriaceae bacterium]